MSLFPRIGLTDRLQDEAKKRAVKAIGGISHECGIGWKVGVTRNFIRAMAKHGGYAPLGMSRTHY